MKVDKRGMADPGRFETLLSHQGPLVHVDHSHRAPAVRTGKCYLHQTDEVVYAYFYVKMEDGYKKEGKFMLTERQCGDSSRARASWGDATDVMNKLVSMAGEETRRAPQRSLNIKMVRDGYLTRAEYLVRVDPNGGIEAYLTPDGNIARRGTSQAEMIREDAYIRLQNFLTNEYDDDNGPLFILEKP